VRLEREGILTKVQHRVGSPHRGGIPFRRGSLFYLLKNPVYRGKIVHRGTVHDGEHVPIVDEELWDAVQAQLREKAPPRKRPKNDRQNALLIGLLADPHGRQIVPTYATKGGAPLLLLRDPVKTSHAPPIRRLADSGQGALDGHALRRLANLEVEEADLLRTMFEGPRFLRSRLKQTGDAQTAIRSLVALIKVEKGNLDLTLKPAALGLTNQPCWRWSIPLPSRKPYREARLRIDSGEPGRPVNDDLLALLTDARAALELVQSSPELSLHQIGKSKGRCRTHLARLLRIAWLSPRIVEAITERSAAP
jgi:site-specific DNA recombinase